jgi:RNA polymerase-associated protein RTF1
MRTPSLDEVLKVSVTRHMLEKWIYAPFFKDTVIGNNIKHVFLYIQSTKYTSLGCFVRLYIGNDPTKKIPVYRICQVTGNKLMFILQYMH